ncbi:MAG: signal peptidase II [Halarcobacter sp.]
MKEKLKVTLFIFVFVFILDQIIKFCFVNYDWNVDGSIISLHLVYNKGVAFSMFSFLQEYLKYLQLLLVVVAIGYLYKNPAVFKQYNIEIGLLFAGGLSNILDRFTYGGVVDYVYWHYGFEFAIFNFADVIIDLAVVLILYKQYQIYKEEKKRKEI